MDPGIKLKDKMKKRIGLFLIAVCTFAHITMAFAASADGAPSHVVILIMDGVRYTEAWGDPEHANIPRIATDLAPNGIVLTHFYTDITTVLPGAKTETVPGHATLVCGTYQNLANNGSELPTEPTIFQYYRKHKKAPASSTWVVTSKDKLVVLANTSNPKWKDQYPPRFNCGVNGDGTGKYREDNLTHPLVLSALTNDHPAVMIINYKGPDAMGHAKNWPGYLAAIQECDGYAAEVWNTIQSDPVMKDTTTLFITTDHGRHTDNFKSHGDGCEGCCHLFCVILGPMIQGGRIDGTRWTQPDITRTAAELLGLSMPTLDPKSHSMLPLFKQPVPTGK
jgi:hypothetical protein